MSGDIVGCHNCVWRSPAPSGWGPGLLLNTLPYKAPGPKVHEPRGCRTLGWVVSEEISNCTIWFPCGGLCLPDHQLEAVTTHSCSPSRPPLCSSEALRKSCTVLWSSRALENSQILGRKVMGAWKTSAAISAANGVFPLQVSQSGHTNS